MSINKIINDVKLRPGEVRVQPITQESIYLGRNEMKCIIKTEGLALVEHSFILTGGSTLDELPAKMEEVLSAYNLKLINKEITYSAITQGDYIKIAILVTFSEGTLRDKGSDEAVKALCDYLNSVEEYNRSLS